MYKNLSKLLLIAAMTILTPLLMADTGPKPTASFEIEYLIEPIPELVEYSLYECDQPNCSDQARLEQLGPQHFECSQDACTSMAYGYARYLYIEFGFDDGSIRTSNIFTKDHFNAEYRITVNREDLFVEEVGGDNRGRFGLIYSLPLFFIFLLACGGLLILGIIALVVVLIVRNTRQPRAKQQ